MERNQSETSKNIYETPEWRQLMESLKNETIAEAVVRYHRNCGSHSNIPPCCVEFFIKYWRSRMSGSWIGSIYSFLKRSCYPVDRKPQYVPCPKCLIKRYAQPLHECDWELGSVCVGECKPTGRVLGFCNDTALPKVPQAIQRK